jgi:transposase
MMAKALSDDLRSRVLKSSSQGLSARQAAARFGVGISSAIRWISRAKIGEMVPRKQGRRQSSVLDVHADFIIGMIDQRQDITLDEMVERFLSEQSLRFGRSTINDWLRKHGWTYKKRPHMHWSKNAPIS